MALYGGFKSKLNQDLASYIAHNELLFGFQRYLKRKVQQWQSLEDLEIIEKTEEWNKYFVRLIPNRHKRNQFNNILNSF